jgi:hypothetical protein
MHLEDKLHQPSALVILSSGAGGEPRAAVLLPFALVAGRA